MARLGDICKFQSGGTPSKSNPDFFGGNIPWITTVALNGGTIGNEDAVEWITDIAIQKSAAKVVPQNSILVGTRVGIGKVAINSVPMSTSQDVIAMLDIDTAIWNKNFLCKFIQLKNDFLLSQARGATVKGIKIETLSNMQVPDIPINEQCRIATVMDKVGALIAKRQAQLDKLDLLVKARFVEMFADFKVNSKGWPVVSFRDIARIDANMTTDYKKYADYPHIGIDCIEKETGMLKGYRTVAEDGVISGKYIFTPKHIIYSKIRPNLNKVALPDFDGLCSADAYPILPIEGKCNRIFLAYDMRSAFFLDYILQYCNRTNLPKVNRKEVEGFNTPLPPLDLQSRFACFVEQTEKTKTNIKQSLEMLETLKKALMQEFFG